MAVPSILLGLYAAQVPLDLSFTGLLDRGDKEVDRYFSTVERLDLGGSLPLLLEGDPKKVDAAVKELAPRLRQDPGVRRVITQPPLQWLEDHAPYLVSKDVFESWVALATRPEDAENAKALAASLEKIRKETRGLTLGDARVVLLTLEKDPMATSMGGGDFAAVQALTDAVMERHPDVKAGYGGLPAIAAQDQSQTLGMVQKLTPVTLVLVLLLLRFVEPSFRRLVAVAVPMVLAVGGTLGLVGLFLNTFTVLETLFGIMVFGLGIDFALHLIVRAREETGHGRPFEEAVLTTWEGAGRGVVAGALTTAGAFFIVAMAPDVSARHLGVSGGIGLLYCLLLMLTVLPAIWSILHRHGVHIGAARMTKDARKPTFDRFTLLRRVSAHAAKNPWLHLGIAAVVLTIALVSLPKLRFETDLEKVFNRDVPAVQTMEKVQELFGLNSSPWFVAADSEDDARKIHARFEASPTFGRVNSIADVLLPDRIQRQQHLAKERQEIETQMRVFEGMIPLVTDAEAEQLRGGKRLLEALLNAEKAGPPEAKKLPAVIAQQYVSASGAFVVYAYPKAPDFDGRNSLKRRVAAQEVHPDATGLGALLSVILGLDRPWTVPVFLGILAFVAVLLAFDLRDPRLIVLSLIPVVWASFVALGIFCWFDIPMNVLMTAVVPLIIGLGVDDGIHVVHRIKEDPKLTVDLAAESVGRAIFMTTITTCVSFSALLFTNHAGMEGMGLVMVIGLPLCLTASVTTLPAAAVLMGVARPPKR